MSAITEETEVGVPDLVEPIEDGFWVFALCTPERWLPLKEECGPSRRESPYTRPQNGKIEPVGVHFDQIDLPAFANLIKRNGRDSRFRNYRARGARISR